MVIAAGGSAGAAHRADAAAQLAGIEQKLERIEARLVALLAPDKEDAS